MDQFNKLPFPQKVGILIVLLGAIGGLFYYTMLTPISESIQQTKGKETGLKDELAKLEKEAAALKPDEMVAKKQSLEQERLGYEELLPKTEELVKFISGLSETAESAGLELMSFEKGKSSNRNYYTQIPIAMSVKGTYRELVGFLRLIAAADRRVVNIRNLKIASEELDISLLTQKYAKQRADALPKGYTLRAPTEQQQMADKLRAYSEVVAAGLELQASFTAFVFLYTGKELTAEQKTLIQTETDLKAGKLRERRAIPL